MSNLKFKRPGTDLSDAETLAGAKRVATRKNNNFKRMVAKKLPLFADELFANYEEVTPEKVVADRKIHQADWNERKKEMRQSDWNWIRRSREEIQKLVSGEKEWRFFIKLVGNMKGGSRSMKWSRALTLIKRRQNERLSDTADLVLTWLRAEEKPVTEFDIWEKRGDGLSVKEIMNALLELMQLGYADTVEIVKIHEKYKNFDVFTKDTAWTWQASEE